MRKPPIGLAAAGVPAPAGASDDQLGTSRYDELLRHQLARDEQSAYSELQRLEERLVVSIVSNRRPDEGLKELVHPPAPRRRRPEVAGRAGRPRRAAVYSIDGDA